MGMGDVTDVSASSSGSHLIPFLVSDAEKENILSIPKQLGLSA